MSNTTHPPSRTAQFIRERVAKIQAIRATNEPQARADELALLWEFVDLVARRAPEPFRHLGQELKKMHRP